MVCCLAQGLPPIFSCAPVPGGPEAGEDPAACQRLQPIAAQPAARCMAAGTFPPKRWTGTPTCCASWSSCAPRCVAAMCSPHRRRGGPARGRCCRTAWEAVRPEILTGPGLAMPAGSTRGTWPARWMANGGRWRSGSPGRGRRRACRSCPRRSAGSGCRWHAWTPAGEPDSLKAAPRDGGGDAAAGRPAGRAACRCMPGPAAWMPAHMLPGPSSCAQDRSRSRRCWWPGHAAWG